MTDHQLVQGTLKFVTLRPGGMRRDAQGPEPGRRAPAGTVHACDEDSKLALCGVQCNHTWNPWPPGMGERCEACVQLVDAG
jgi:hypothetical protein